MGVTLRTSCYFALVVVVACSRSALDLGEAPSDGDASSGVMDAGPPPPADSAATDASPDAPKADSAKADGPNADGSEADAAGTQSCPSGVRPIAPMSTSVVTGARPELRFQHGTVVTVHVELCADNGCTQVLEALDTSATSASPTRDLRPGPVFWRVSSQGCPGPVWEFRVPFRSAPVDASWIDALDVNLDGYADLATFDPMTTTACVYFGGTGGLSAGNRECLPPRGPLLAPVNAGDLNGDGYGDIAVLRPLPNGPFAIDVYFGPVIGLDRAPSITVPGSAQAVARGIGDVDGDGYGDLLVGVPATTSGSPTTEAAYIYHGSPSGPSSAATAIAGPPGSRFGAIVAAAGDIYADHSADFAIWAENTGQVSVFRGLSNGLLPITALQFSGGDLTAMAGVGDVDGDGYADLAMGFISKGPALYRGGSAGIDVSHPQAPPVSGELPGWALCAAGDVDGDGYADIGGGSPPDSSTTAGGSAWVVTGSSAGVQMRAPEWIVAPASALGFGWAVTSGDFDGDRHSDLAVAAMGSNATFVYRGSAAGIGTTPVASVSGSF
jgi:hypothetical protein